MNILKISDDEYRNLDAYNFSMLSAFERKDIRDFAKEWIFKTAEKKDEVYFKKGSLFDMLLTAEDEVFDRFYIVDELPSETIQKIGDYILGKMNLEFVPFSDELILEARKIAEYQTNWKDDTVIKKLKEAGLDNYIDIRKTSDKTFIDLKKYDNIVSKSLLIKSNHQTSKYFEQKEGIEIFYQPVFVFEFADRKFKCKLDILYIDHVSQTIEIVDIKSTSKNIFSFFDSILEYRYDLQGAIYNKAMEIQKYDEAIFDYNIIVKFVALNLNDCRPVVFEFPRNILWSNMLVGESEKRRGALEIIKDIEWHKENNQWEYKRGFENNYVLLKEEQFQDVQRGGCRCSHG